MSGARSPWAAALVVVAVVVAPGGVTADSIPASTTPTAELSAAIPADDPFPEFEAIRPNIEFWKQVYAKWSLAQVAVHDSEFPAIVYEIVDLPGSVEERYTEQQTEFVEELAEAWEDRLRALERNVARRRELTHEEKVLALLITTNAGSEALEDAHKRVRTQRGMRERFRRGVEISHRYDGLIRDVFRLAGLPESLACLPHVESSFQAAARSSAGAVGVWQFTRGTGRRYLTINSAIDERLDPVIAARGAAAYLRDAFDKLGDWPIALTSYNHGVAGMQRAVKQFGADYERIFREYEGRLFGFASRNFYAEFIAARQIVSDPLSYFPEGFQPDPPLGLDRVELESRSTPARIARAHGVSLEELAALNPAWSRRAVRSGLALPKGTEIWLPKGNLADLARRGHRPDYGVSIVTGRGGVYIVQPGDSLSEIAAAHGLSLARLRELNGIPRNESLIRVGQRLRVSDGSDEMDTHVVRRGESLSTIARLYGMKVSALRELNGIPSGESLIRVGQRLRVVGGGPISGEPEIHIVRRGDSLTHIASLYGVGLSELLRLNRLTVQSVIHPGQRLRIP